MKSGLRILIPPPQVPFLVPPKMPKMGHFGCFGLFWGYRNIWIFEIFENVKVQFLLNFDRTYINQVLTVGRVPKYSMKNISIWYLSNILEVWAKNVKGGLSRLKFLGWHMRSLPEENLEIVFLTVAPFIVKFRFEKYRYLLTHLLCLQIFEVLFSDNHSTGPRNVSAVSAFACLVWWYCHFVPKYMMKVKLIKYWMPNIMSEKIIHWENGDWGKHLTKIP